MTGLASDAGSGTRLVKLLGHLTTSTSSGFSNNNGPMYGYPSERQETATGSNYGPPPKPSEKYYGKFDLDKAESYQQKQENALEDALGNGSAAFGLVGDGAGWVGTVLGLTSYQKAIVRRNRYSGYTSDMRDEIWNMEMSPCYKSHENPAIKEIYETYLGEPGSQDRKSTRLNSSHPTTSRMPSSA